MLIGIDLGTTHSLAAIWREGEAVLIPNALGEFLTPSAVSIDETQTVLVGRAARDRCLTQPHNGALTFKRLMGTERSIPLGKKVYRPEELSALLLKNLKADAEHFLGAAVTRAVITVPAYFSDAQRKATRLAGELAGFKVERLVNEPTAAALAYGLQEQPPESLFMVLDLGGGTFDVSILERFEGVMEVRASTGDNFLGGEDFVAAIVAHLRKTWNLPDKDDSADAQLLKALLWTEGERIKRQLSIDDTVTGRLDWAGHSHECALSAAEFEHLAEPLLQRFRLPIERALRDAKVRPAELDQVVLAGGATRMPIIRRLVARMFGRMPAMHLNPDEVIARGAAVMAGLIERDAALEEVVMTDVCPYTLGTDVGRTMEDGSHRGGFFSPIIERNTVVPVSREESYCNASDFQKTLSVGIFQGEARLVKDNIWLGEVSVPIPPRKAGEVSIVVRFSYDVSGLLEVDVQVPETGVRKNLVLERHPGLLDEKEIARVHERLAKLKVHPRDQAINIATLTKAERLHEQLLGRERRALADAITRFETVLARQELEAITAARGDLEQLLQRLDQPYF